MGCQQSSLPHTGDTRSSSSGRLPEDDELSYFSTTNILRAALVAANDTCDASLLHAILTKKPHFIANKIRDASLVHSNCTDARHEMLRTLLRHGASADDGLEDGGVSALHLAVMANQPRAVEILVEYGATVNAPMRTPAQPLDGMAPLHLAARSGFADVAQVLLASDRVDLSATDAKGFTASQLAVTRPAGFPVVRLLHPIGLAANLASQNDNAGHDVPLLVLAIRPDNLPTIRHLLKLGSKVRVADVAVPDTGVTPLMVASADGLVDVVTLLLAHGANVNAVRTHEPIDSTALFEAAYHGHHEIVALLLHAGARHDILTGENGMTPLHAACSHGHVECIELLCHAGADVNSPSRHRHPQTNDNNDDQLTPAHLAAMDGHCTALDILAKYGADVVRASARGQTPLLVAAAHGQSAFLVHLLDQYNVDVEHRDQQGWNALDTATARGQTHTARVLRDRAASVNASVGAVTSTSTNVNTNTNAKVNGFHPSSGLNRLKISQMQLSEETPITEAS